MELQNGRPADAAGRMDKEIRTYDFLDSLGVDYQRMDHEAAFTMEACKEVDEALGVEMCKNLFLCNRQKTDFMNIFTFPAIILRFLSLFPFDTGGQGVQDERTLKTDRQCEAFFCECRIYGKISGYYAGSGQHYGTDE